MLSRPLWHDELFTIWAARFSLPRLIETLRADSGPPLFYLLEKPLVMLGEGTGVSPLCRLLPFLAILLLFAGALELEEASRARLVVLLATSPFLLVYAAEARAYGLLAVLDFALFFLLFRLEPTRGRLAAAALIVALALWTHYTAIFFVGSIVALSIARRRWGNLAAVAAGIALFSPWIPILLAQPPEATAWMREPIGRSAVAFFSALGGGGRIPDPLGGPLPQILLWTTGMVGFAVAAILAARAAKDPALADASALVALTTALVVAASLVRRVAFPGRSELAVWAVALWAIARAAGQSRSAKWAARAVIACAFISSTLVILARKEEPEPSSAANFVAGIAQRDDVVIAAAAFYLPARLLHDRGELAAPVFALPRDVADHPGWFTADAPKDADYRAIADTLATLGPGRRAFVLLHPIFRTARLAALLASRGVVRVMSDRPQTVVLVCTAR